MGLLDEAIKEHLDLKRRRGADPAEVDRAEREALGPVRRQPEPEADHQPDAVEDMNGGGSEEAPAPMALEPAAPDVDQIPVPAIDPDLGEEPFESPLPVGGMTAPSENVGPETVEYDVEQEHAESAESAPGEDVLEETPEFLQDTPDHDRLWFEQRPPKDFDFEG